jgi:hypothetical protein
MAYRQNPNRTEGGKVKLLDKNFPPVVIERHAGDAREMEGQYPEVYKPIPASEPSITDILNWMAMDELQDLARQNGIRTFGEQRDFLVSKLTPLVEARKVRLPVEVRIRGEERAAVLKRLTRQLRRRGKEPTAVELTLLMENRNRCHPPLPEPEVRQIAGMEFEPEDPADEPDWDARLFGATTEG